MAHQTIHPFQVGDLTLLLAEGQETRPWGGEYYAGLPRALSHPQTAYVITVYGPSLATRSCDSLAMMTPLYELDPL